MENDERIRQEFAKAFGWYLKRGMYDNYSEEPKPLTPSWEEIFREIGNLQNSANRLSDEYRVQGLEKRVNELENKVTNL